MFEWKKKFDQDTLQRAEKAFLNKRVVDIKKTELGFSGAVLGRERYETAYKKMPTGTIRLSCTCPTAKGGRPCEHMASLLYALEAVEKAEKASQEGGVETDKRSAEEAAPEEKKKTPQENLPVTRKKTSQKAGSGAKKKEEEKARLAAEKKEEQKARLAAEKAAEEARRMAEEREARRIAREERKAERARKKEEQKRAQEEAARLEYEKKQAEEARREAIRQQKAEEARRRAEKKEKEQEMTRIAEEQRRKEEEKARRAELRRLEREEKRRAQEEQKRLEEKRRQEEEERRVKEEQERAAKALLEAKEAARLDRKKREAEYAPLGDSWEEPEDTGENSEGIEKLSNYHYFNGANLLNQTKITNKARTDGEKYLKQGKISIKQVISGFIGSDNERRGQMDAVGMDGKNEFNIRIQFTRSEITMLECNCPRCRYDYYGRYETQKVDCGYKAGSLSLLNDFLKEHNIGDATDAVGQTIINIYDRKRANLVRADYTGRGQNVTLQPRLTKKNDKLSLSFKIGVGKLFIVKKLDELCQNVKMSATAVYGSNTEINHSIDNFSEKGKEWIRFINRVAREETEFLQRLEESRYYYGRTKESIGSSIDLFGWRLDDFYRQLGEESIEFEDKDSSDKKKGSLTCRSKSPRVTMNISGENYQNDKQFHGIHVTGTIPDLYYGIDAAYYISDNHINSVDKAFLENLEPLANMSSYGTFDFHVGRNRMSEFYNRILPQLQDVVEVTETQPEIFRSYLMPVGRYVFYLDAREGNAYCRPFVSYGDREACLVDLMVSDKRKQMEPFRDISREEEVLYHVRQWFPEADLDKEELHCGFDEEKMYDVMDQGAQKLMEFGEVRCTKSFLGYHTVSKVKVSVGVSVASGLLELDIATEDVPPQELLDILESYRRKKRYYRLKNGSFVNLDEPSLEMLAELMDSMHVKPREFVKGKFHLPLYRTLYLDKMLEENEDVYSSRDSHFRKVVKGFKTVKDADFEEPKILSQIMRKYQKDGYKWLRTLEAWQFGGILADDMGLGKTLQVIAVLLAAKEEGKQGTSLVVAPASLVFNWGEEFQRFAPQLKISLITGTQEERQEKLAAYKEADVLVTSYDLLKRDIVNYEDKTFDYEVIDEAQYIKNHTTAAAKAVKLIKSRIRYALTGTPIENRLSELWSIFDYLMPGFLYTYDVFKREMETPIVKNDDEHAMKRLQKMVGPFILRRLKENVLKDLPEKLEEVRYVRLGREQQKVYDGQVVHMKEAIAKQDAEEFNKNKLLILAELTRLRQLCCDPSLCFENYKGESAKLEACIQLVVSAIDGGHRILVFSQFTSMLELISQELKALAIPFYTITGATSKEKRLQLVKDFNEGDTPVFLISLKAGGVGLNLTGADMVLHYDPWWNLAVQNQATDRAHRIGQTKKVTVFKLIAKHTIEEKIQKLQETKKNLADQIVNGESAGLSSMSREELLELLEV